MTFEAWFTLGTIVTCFGLLASNRFGPDLIMMAGLTLLLIAGILTPKQALAGLANEGMITVAVLYIVVTGLRETGGIGWLVQTILGVPKSKAHAQLKLMVPVAAMSGFLNNTPVVAIFIPAVKDWAKRNRLSLSQLMIPLSFASIAGGTCTLIGTSTNLVVNGLLITETDLPGLNLFELAWVGLPIVLVVLVFIIVFSKWLLPDRLPVIGDFDDLRKYMVEMQVEPNSHLVGKSIEEAGLRQLPSMFLMEIDRDRQIMPVVSPKERLRGNDRLVFVGIVDSVVDLQKIRGLKPATDQIIKLDSHRQDRTLIEAVVSNSCPLVGKSIREGRFRTHYNAVIIALARNNEQIRKKIGDIVLRAGDTLLLETRASFVTQQQNSRDFYLVSQVEGSQPLRFERALVAVAIIISMVMTVALGWLSMLKAAMLAAGLMIITRCTMGRIARRAVDWEVLVVIAASFGIATALQTTGAASEIAKELVSFGGSEPWIALILVFILTAIFSALATNNAAAVLMFPIALATANGMGVSVLPFAITIMVAASASFSTPIGYQTNLMVYGAGGYRFIDYIRIGVPLTILVGIVTVTITPLVWRF